MWKKRLRKGGIEKGGAKDRRVVLGADGNSRQEQDQSVYSQYVLPVSERPPNKIGVEDQNLIIRAA